MLGPATCPPRPRRRTRRGFTLLETALATVILGVGVLALIEAHTQFSRHNDWSSSSATAAYLANELRERMRGLPRHDPVTGLRLIGTGNSATAQGWGREANETSLAQFDDIDDFDGVTFGFGGNFPGPVDSTGTVILESGPDGEPMRDAQGNFVPMRGWSQTVSVTKVDPFNFAQTRPTNYVQAAVPPDFPGLGIDQFPLRVTVIVRYRQPATTEVEEMARVSWIVPR